MTLPANPLCEECSGTGIEERTIRYGTRSGHDVDVDAECYCWCTMECSRCHKFLDPYCKRWIVKVRFQDGRVWVSGPMDRRCAQEVNDKMLALPVSMSGSVEEARHDLAC